MDDDKIGVLPQNFLQEKKELFSEGITTWEELMKLEDKKLFHIVQKGLSTTRNLNRLRGMARLISELRISSQEAAILMHTGIASIEALASITPEELMKQAGRLERKLKSGRKPVIDLIKANCLIQSAKKRQLQN